MDETHELPGLVGIVNAQVRRKEVERLVVELGAELALAAVELLLVDVLVAVDAASEAGLGRDDELVLDVVAEEERDLIVALRPEVVLRNDVELLQRLVVGPGAARPSGICRRPT